MTLIDFDLFVFFFQMRFEIQYIPDACTDRGPHALQCVLLYPFAYSVTRLTEVKFIFRLKEMAVLYNDKYHYYKRS